MLRKLISLGLAGIGALQIVAAAAFAVATSGIAAAVCGPLAVLAFVEAVRVWRGT